MRNPRSAEYGPSRALGSTTIASSAALATNKIVVGGGAGTTPATDANWSISTSGSETHVFQGNKNAAALETSLITTGGWTPIIHIANADNSESDVFLDTYGTGWSPTINFRSAGGTGASPTATKNADIVGQFGAWGYGATGFCTSPRAFARFTATEDWSDTAQGMKTVFSATQAGTAVNTPVATFDFPGLLVQRNQ